MPCILKQKTKSSPGIITFTNNEVLNGVISKSPKVQKFLQDQSEKKNWIFGVHIQGSCSNLVKWPLESWQYFILWPDLTVPYLADVSKEKLPGINCINFMPEVEVDSNITKLWDICVVSRPSTIKRIKETLDIVRSLMNKKPNLKVIFIVPDPRNIKKGEDTYELDDIDRRFFELPTKFFSTQELKNISFICSSIQSFGNFPVKSDLLIEMVRKSKFLLLTSHKEGMGRVLVEALQVGTPCIVPKTFESGIRYALTSKNTLFIDDNISSATDQIFNALRNYSRFSVDIKKIVDHFGEKKNLPILKKYLSDTIKSLGSKVIGEWYLKDLHFRLACHGQKYNFQFMNDEKSFFYWFDKIEQTDPYDEDKLWRKEEITRGILPLVMEKRIKRISLSILMKLIKTKSMLLNLIR